MAINWMLLLAKVPWTEVIKNAPEVADGARKLWQKVRGTEAAAGAQQGGPALVPLDAAAPLQHQLAAQQARVDELQGEMLAVSELVKTLAEQNTQLVLRIETNRRQMRWLWLVVLVLGLLVLLGLGRGTA